MKIKKLTERQKGFQDGYICCVANMLRQHGDTVIAKDALRCIGKLDKKTIEPYDREELERQGFLKQENEDE